MSIKLSIIAIPLFFSSIFNEPGNGEKIVKMMHTRNAGKWHKAVTFDQTTEMYRNDSLKRTQEWHEAIFFPDKLRIDIEPVANDNAIIFRNDSTYSIRNGQIKAARSEENDLIFLLGGMYSYPAEKVVAKMNSLGYDLSKAYESEWNGKPVYIVGAADKNDKVNQLWIDKENLYLVRMLKYGKENMEGIFENHIKVSDNWTETKATFYFEGKLAQIETYHNYKATPSLDERIFNVDHFQKFTR
jgi:hypothetical protein